MTIRNNTVIQHQCLLCRGWFFYGVVEIREEEQMEHYLGLLYSIRTEGFVCSLPVNVGGGGWGVEGANRLRKDE